MEEEREKSLDDLGLQRSSSERDATVDVQDEGLESQLREEASTSLHSSPEVHQPEPFSVLESSSNDSVARESWNHRELGSLSPPDDPNRLSLSRNVASQAVDRSDGDTGDDDGESLRFLRSAFLSSLGELLEALLSARAGQDVRIIIQTVRVDNSADDSQATPPSGTIQLDVFDFVHALLGQYQSGDAQPASKAAVAALPRVSCSDHGSEDEFFCAICREDNSANEAIRLPCSHMFHESCVCSWFATKNSCPMCRYALPVEESDVNDRELMTRSLLFILDEENFPSGTSPATVEVEEEDFSDSLRHLFDLADQHVDARPGEESSHECPLPPEAPSGSIPETNSRAESGFHLQEDVDPNFEEPRVSEDNQEVIGADASQDDSRLQVENPLLALNSGLGSMFEDILATIMAPFGNLLHLVGFFGLISVREVAFGVFFGASEVEDTD